MLAFIPNCFFIYGIGFLHPAFWSYVASILCWLFIYRNCILHSAIMLPLIHSPCFVYGNLHFGIMLPRFHAPCFIYGICILRSGIMLPRFHAPFLFMVFVFCILELCWFDSMIIHYLRYLVSVFYILEFNVFTVTMLPRFHRVRTRWPGNNLEARL